MVKDPADVLDRQKCLDALAALRHAKWFQVRNIIFLSYCSLMRCLMICLSIYLCYSFGFLFQNNEEKPIMFEAKKNIYIQGCHLLELGSV